MTNKSCSGQKSDQTDIQVEKRSIRGSCTIPSSTRYVPAKALYGFKTPEQRVLGLFFSLVYSRWPAWSTGHCEQDEWRVGSREKNDACCMQLFSYLLDQYDNSTMVDSSTVHRTCFTTHDWRWIFRVGHRKPSIFRVSHPSYLSRIRD